MLSSGKNFQWVIFVFGLSDQAVGAIVAALIAGLVSLFGLIISKEQKVSEFRQEWIDALRIDLAAVITHAHAIHGAYLAKYNSTVELWNNVRGDFVGINEAWARIKLRLNPKEQPSIAVLETLKEYEALFPSVTGNPPDFSKLDALDKRLLANAQVLLKREWNRVRSGELSFRVAKGLAFLLIAGAVFALIWRVLR